MSKDDKKLTKFERLLLRNQMRILEALYPDEADDIATQREALERGYELLYQWQADFIYEGDDAMTAEECLEVWDTLDMFDAIDRFFKKNPTAESGDLLFSKFRGYDGNNESKFMAFAAFTVERLGRFDYVPLERAGYWNSHMPMRPIYGRMQAVWSQHDREDRFNMSEDLLRAVLQSTDAPDQHLDDG